VKVADDQDVQVVQEPRDVVVNGGSDQVAANTATLDQECDAAVGGGSTRTDTRG
jgi:hypothetical protein